MAKLKSCGQTIIVLKELYLDGTFFPPSLHRLILFSDSRLYKEKKISWPLRMDTQICEHYYSVNNETDIENWLFLLTFNL